MYRTYGTCFFIIKIFYMLSFSTPGSLFQFICMSASLYNICLVIWHMKMSQTKVTMNCSKSLLNAPPPPPPPPPPIQHSILELLILYPYEQIQLIYYILFIDQCYTNQQFSVVMINQKQWLVFLDIRTAIYNVTFKSLHQLKSKG